MTRRKTPAAKRGARSKRPDTLAAYDLVMRSLPHLWAHSPADNTDAIGLLEADQAILGVAEIDLAEALAHPRPGVVGV